MCCLRIQILCNFAQCRNICKDSEWKQTHQTRIPQCSPGRALKGEVANSHNLHVYHINNMVWWNTSVLTGLDEGCLNKSGKMKCRRKCQKPSLKSETQRRPNVKMVLIKNEVQIHSAPQNICNHCWAIKCMAQVHLVLKPSFSCVSCHCCKFYC